MALLNSNELRISTVFTDDSQTFVVLKYQHIKKGRGQATIRVKVKNIETGAIFEKTYSNEQKVEAADVEKRTAQYLYQDGSDAHFMDTADYSQFSLPMGQIEWELNFLKDGDKVVATFLESRPVSIEIPKSSELIVEDTTPAVPGNTATGAMKDAILETGYKIQVPLFVENGNKLKVNTETGTYVSRA